MSSYTGNQPHSLQACGKPFSSGDEPYMNSKDTLTRHVQIQNVDEPYICGSCGKSFTQKCKLKRHLLIHTGDKPYKCDFCGKSFAQKHYISTHMLIHTGNKPHKCDFC